MDEWLLLASSPAGSTDDDTIEAARRELAAGAAVEVARCARPDDIGAAFDRRRGRRVAVAGGDGTLHLAVTEAYRRGELADMVFALLPLGTGNDFARSLGIPLDTAEAARIAARGEPRPLDLIVDGSGAPVVNAVHVGVGADAAASAQRHKRPLGRYAFSVGAVVAGARCSGWRLRVVVDGRVIATEDRPALVVAVANGSSVGGGTPLLPGADPGDGRLDVLVSHATGLRARTAYGLAQRRGTHTERPDVVVTTGREVTVTGEAVKAVADGELSPPRSSWTWSVRPAAWRLVLP